MNALMMTLSQPLTVAVLARCLGLGPQHKKDRPALRRRSRNRLVDDELPALPALNGDDEATHPGCGWFDSSHELHQGLVVLEHGGAERLGGELPVTLWLQLVLDGAATNQGMMQP